MCDDELGRKLLPRRLGNAVEMRMRAWSMGFFVVFNLSANYSLSDRHANLLIIFLT